jgi:TetR/AcrR family transcriptional regulator, cholesterol catabolism regulator
MVAFVLRKENAVPKGIPLTEEEQAQRRKEIFSAAVHLFIRQGFNETSMRQIADAAGMGKSSLYDYYKTKDEILLSYFEDEIQTITRRAQQVQEQHLPAVERLRRVMQAHLEYLLENKAFYLRLTVEAQRLGIESQQRMQASRHAYQDLIAGLVRQGIAEGAFRPVDPFLAMRVILAVMTPVVFTTRPTGSPQEMLDTSLEIVLKGIQA